MKFKKSISFVLTLCMVLSLFATFVIPASAEATNVALNKEYTTVEALSGYEAKLTDGVKHTAMAYSGDHWFAFKCHPTDASGNTGGERFASVVIDLAGVYDLSEIKINAIVNDGSGISQCSDAKAFFSLDGETWGDAVALAVPEETLAANTVYTIGGAVEGTAQFVKVQLTLGAKTFLFFNEIEVFGTEAEEAPVTSNVVTDWNVASYKDSSFGASAAIIFTDAEAYLATGEGYSWWSHVSFKPTDVAGVYEVVEYKHAAGTAASFEIAEGGFVWMSHDTAEAGTPGAYVQALVQTLAAGDLIEFVGVDFANKTTTADATAGVWVDPNAPVNVALGKDYVLSGCGNRTTYYADLTDGASVSALTNNNNVDWFGFYCNGTDASVINAPDKVGTVVIDLGAMYDITSMRTKTIAMPSWGIAAAGAINFYASADGVEYTLVGSGEVTTDEAVGYWSGTDCEVTARFVKLEVKLAGTFAFINEFEVYGTKAPEAGLAGENVSRWEAGAEFAVLTDGDNGVGEVNNYNPFQPRLFGVASGVMEATDYTLTFVIDKAEFNTITLYALDFANGGVMLPEAVTFVVDGVKYEAAINANANGIATIVATLDEAVTANCVVAEVTMGASPYSFTIFNMFTEFEVSLVEDDDESYKDTHTYVDGVNVGTIQQLGEAWADKPASDFWYLVDSGKETVTISVVVDDRAIVADDTQLRVWIETDKDYTKRTTLVDVKVKDGEAYVARIDGGFDAAVKSVTYEAVGKDYKLVLVLDKATLGITGEYGLNVQLGQTGSTTMHSIKYDNVTGEGATYAPWTTTEFYEIFDKAPVTSQVVENFNHADWNTGVNTFHAAYIFTDAEMYKGVGMAWWYHAAFAPVANGAYKVVGIAAPGSDAATNNTLEIPEGGFVWVAWTSSESGNGKSSGAYAKALMSTLKEGDLVVFNGLDIAKLTTTEDATATKIDTSADVDLLISHNYNFNWHCFEGEIISGAVADAPKFAGDAPFLKDSIEAADILYVVENVKGAYLVTGFVTGSAIPETAIPEGGFVYYVTANCTNYDKICHGELVGKYIILGDIDLATKFAIDTQAGNPAYAIQAVSSFKTGDADLDGKITATDYAIIRKLVLGTLTADDVNELALKAADVNGNGKVDARDYYLVKRAFLGTYVIPGWEAEDAE